jgi:flagellar biosynthesis protein FliP
MINQAGREFLGATYIGAIALGLLWQSMGADWVPGEKDLTMMTLLNTMVIAAPVAVGTTWVVGSV